MPALAPRMGFTFRLHERLKRREDFIRVRREGCRRSGRLLILWALHRGEVPARPTRLGVVASRRDGNAVRRNRFKRRMRESFRLHKHLFPRGWDLIVAPRTLRGNPAKMFPAPTKNLLNDFLETARPLLGGSRS